MLSWAERDSLLGKLTAALSPLSPRPALAAAIGDNFIALVPVNVEYPMEYAQRAIDVCVRDRWDHEPPWLWRLLGILPDEPDVALIRNRVRLPPPVPSPVLARVLANGSPFVGRVPLRDKLEALRTTEPPPPQATLVVSGATKSGKTYTIEYINHLVSTGLHFEVCYVQFPRGNGLVFGPAEVARKMLSRMGLPPHELPGAFFEITTNAELWPAELAENVLSHARNHAKDYWLVLDEFSGADLREDTRKFVTSLAESLVQSSDLRRHFRLVLIDFDRTLLTVGPGNVDVERIGAIGETDVLRCLSDIYVWVNAPRADDDLKPMLATMLDGLPNDDGRLIELNYRLLDLMKELSEAKDDQRE